METRPAEIDARGERWRIVRDVLVFQCKLLVDGFRDLVLVPVSLLAGAISVIGKGGRPGPEFYDLLRMARRSERWINLFGAVEQRPPQALDDGAESQAATAQDLDALIARVETFLVDEYRNGGITAQAKARLDAALESLQGVRERMGRHR